MSPKMGQMLLDGVRPILHAVIGRGKVKMFGAEDAEELEADAMSQAAAIVDSAERAGKEVFPSSVAYFALCNLQKGRRWGCSTGDLMSPALRLSGKVRAVESLDAPIGNGDEDPDDEPTLLDSLASSGEDGGAAAARAIDWEAAATALDDRELDVLGATAAGLQGTELAAAFNVSTPRITQIKRAIGDKLRYELGNDVLAVCVCETQWQRGMRSYREKRACRYDDRAATRKGKN